MNINNTLLKIIETFHANLEIKGRILIPKIIMYFLLQLIKTIINQIIMTYHIYSIRISQIVKV